MLEDDDDEGFDDMALVVKEDFFEEEDWEMERGFWNQRKAGESSGRSAVTGY